MGGEVRYTYSSGIFISTKPDVECLVEIKWRYLIIMDLSELKIHPHIISSDRVH